MHKILIMGAYPPPVGGNSVHIKRLKELLDLNVSCCCKVLDIYSPQSNQRYDDVVRVGPPGIVAIFKSILYLRKYKPDVLHIHVSAMGKFLYFGIFILFFVKNKTKKIITIHSGSFVKKLKKYNYYKIFFTKYLLNKFNEIITVNAIQKCFLLDVGVNAANISIVPAFLPPTPKYSEELERVVTNFKKKHSKLLITSGYGVPLYGYDKIISVINEQSENNSTPGLLICVYNTYDEKFMNQLLLQIADPDSILILRDLSENEFSYVLKFADVYIRATDRDGDAVAIREANYFNVPVLASDVVERPCFCKLFDLNSLLSLRDGLSEILSLDAYDSGEDKTDSIIGKIKDIYNIL